MFNNAKTFPKTIDKLKYIVAKPGWQPAELGGQIPIPEVDYSKPKYDAKASSKSLNIYVLVQFAFIIIGLSAYLYHYEKLSTFYTVIFSLF